jgi:hypothetical protein
MPSITYPDNKLPYREEFRRALREAMESYDTRTESRHRLGIAAFAGYKYRAE